jgi:hypothetical protein
MLPERNFDMKYGMNLLYMNFLLINTLLPLCIEFGKIFHDPRYLNSCQTIYLVPALHNVPCLKLDLGRAFACGMLSLGEEWIF